MSLREKSALPPPLDLSGWRKAPVVLMVIGGILSVIGLIASPEEFGYSWLTAFMFYLTIALGALFLVLVHHLTDAGWSVATRRFCEHLASLLSPCAGNFICSRDAAGAENLSLVDTQSRR